MHEGSMMNLLVRAATDLGRKRAQNEDCLAYWIPDNPAEDQGGALLVVADGMGGSRAGEVASRLAVESVMESYREAQGGTVLENLSRSIKRANQVVHEQSMAHPEMRGMGTTCTAVVLRDDLAYIAHVGDSRAYLV